MRAALITAALGHGKTDPRQKKHSVWWQQFHNGPCRCGKLGWVARLADLILVLHSTAVERVYAFTNGFFHRAITRKRNNVSNKDFIPVTLIYLNTGGGGGSSNSFILPAFTACMQPTNANTGGGGGDFVAVSHTTSRNNMGQGKEKQFMRQCVCAHLPRT